MGWTKPNKVINFEGLVPKNIQVWRAIAKLATSNNHVSCKYSLLDILLIPQHCLLCISFTPDEMTTAIFFGIPTLNLCHHQHLCTCLLSIIQSIQCKEVSSHTDLSAGSIKKLPNQLDCLWLFQLCSAY